MLFSLVRDGLLSMEKASARAGMTENEFAARMEQPSIDGAERRGRLTLRNRSAERERFGVKNAHKTFGVSPVMR